MKRDVNDEFIEEYIRIGSINENDRVLSVGPGSSSTTLPFALAASCHHVYRIDTRPSMISFLEQEKLRRYVGNALTFGIWEEKSGFPCADSSYDVVSFYGTVNNVSDPWKIFGDAFRVLRATGKLLWGGICVEEKSKKYRELLRAIENNAQDPVTRYHIIKRYTFEEQMSMAFKAGFKFILFRPFLHRVDFISQFERTFSGDLRGNLMKEALATIKNSHPDNPHEDAYGFIAVLAKHGCDSYKVSIMKRESFR
ncbi:MAG: class I SAM-dependent methyltransferase [Deltaproteobacteria bacterium]|nr:class I SAM-dependent methyltransferase [Deltaproteobacteria bacterium]MBM4321938.1 class I SAM-dependent methyltransferase [Deltaproteobacteria bacterium]